MEITFGIITSGENDCILSTVITSIINQHIPTYEIIIVGSTSIQHECVRKIEFDETIKRNWITRKKNMICEESKYNMIVLLHDYVMLCDDWYQGFLHFGSNFDICVTKIKNLDGRRYRDYCLFPYDLGYPYEQRGLLPYDYKVSHKINKLMYISGAYYIIKKHIALNYPLDERLGWGHGEDAELSKRLTEHHILLQCNPYSTVQLLKQKYQAEWEYEMTPDELSNLESLSDEKMIQLSRISINNIKKFIWNNAHIHI